MNFKELLCAVSAVALGSVSVAQAQSLTDLAKQEKQRRAKMQTPPSKVYTETTTTTVPATVDSGAPTTTVPAGDAAAPGAKKATKEKTPEELQAEKQAEWNARLKKAQEDITAMQATIASKERTLNSTYNITPARADLASQIETDKKKLAELQQQLVALEDERRRAGMPRTR